MNNTPETPITDGTKSVIRKAVSTFLPRVIKWLVSDHSSALMRRVTRGVRMLLIWAGASGAGQVVLDDAQLAKIADWIIMGLPTVLEFVSYFRERIMAWVDRRWPSAAIAEHQARVLPSPECSGSALNGGTK